MMNTISSSLVLSVSPLEPPSPYIIRIFNWLRENRQATIDLIVLMIMTGGCYSIFAITNVTEMFYQYTRTHEGIQLDDVLFTLGTVFSLGLAIFALRRWKESDKRLALSNTDSLTGLYNRRKGWDVFEAEMARAKRYQRPLSMILFDIDKFKSINDTQGHLAGDKVLKTIARFIQEKLRSTDFFVRWGGDEFVIIAPEIDHKGIRHEAERLRAEVERYFVQGAVGQTISLGITQMRDADSVEAFLLRADKRLYEAKAKGGNRVA